MLKLGRESEGRLESKFLATSKEEHVEIGISYHTCRDFTKILYDFATRLRQNRRNFSPDHGIVKTFFKKHA